MSGRILIVDQVPVNRIILKVKLSAAHYDVLMASTANDALKLARREQPDLVIAGLGTEDLSGIELCARLKSRRITSRIPVLLTGVATGPQERIDALKAGAEAFVAHFEITPPTKTST